MHYLLFNNGVIISDGLEVRRMDLGQDIKNTLAGIEKARICVVDVDVLIAAAVESPLEKKDSLLVRKFKELYQHESYIIQDEKIDSNLFQVIGIKEQRVREIYSLIPPSRVESFVPYGMALRRALVNQKADLNKTIVMVDDTGQERLLTVFDGLKFSRTRVIAVNDEDLLPEIKRSQIDFFKKNEEYLSKKSTDFLILVNNRKLADELSENKEHLPVKFFNAAHPALEGLKDMSETIKYVLPEEIIKKRKNIKFKENITAAIVSLCVVAFGLFYYLFNKIEAGLINAQIVSLKTINRHLDEELKSLDRDTYRVDLRKQKFLNYGIFYLSVLDSIPPCYEITSFKFARANRWNLEMMLSIDKNGPMDPLVRTGILKDAEIKDVFVNDEPGKHLRIIL